jgi:hypothetical protein
MLANEFHIHLYGPSAAAANQTAPLPTSFEAAQGRLEAELPEALLEPDGSLAWASPTHQVVGMIYDAAMQIQYVELRGRCDPPRLRRLVTLLAGTVQVDRLRVMVLPQRHWKDFQSFETLMRSADSEGSTGVPD